MFKTPGNSDNAGSNLRAMKKAYSDSGGEGDILRYLQLSLRNIPISFVGLS